jgi:hypothetical protein
MMLSYPKQVTGEVDSLFSQIPSWRAPEFAHHHRMKQCLPDPRDVAARKALAAMPPAPLERVLQQAEASRKFIAEWRAKGLPDLPDTLRPPALR